MIVSMLITLLAAAEVTPGQRLMLKPQSTTAVAAPGKMGYYLMQGRQIISKPFANVSDCYKALAQMHTTITPGLDTVVCVHRAPGP